MGCEILEIAWSLADYCYMILEKYVKLSEPQFSTYTIKKYNIYVKEMLWEKLS